MNAMLTKRGIITAALATADIAQVGLTKSYVPDDINAVAAIVSLANESGSDATHRKCLRTKIEFEVFIFVSRDLADPDSTLYSFKEAFRDAYQVAKKDDLPEVTYYDSYVESQPVRVCMLTTKRRSDNES